MRIIPPNHIPPLSGDFHHEEEIDLPPHFLIPDSFGDPKEGQSPLTPPQEFAAFLGLFKAIGKEKIR